MPQTLSQLANELRPYIQPWIQTAIGGAGAGTTAPTTNAHDLNGALHRGTLADSQGPQFLLRDGSRALTGNLAVNDGKTVDGVDVSAHAADPNAHHARAHGILTGADHTVSGTTGQVVGLATGTTLGLYTPNAAPGSTEAILKTNSAGKLTLLTFQVTGTIFADDILDFGTDTIAEDATYLRFAGAKPVHFAQTVQSGSAWSITTSGDVSGRDFYGRAGTFTEDFYAADTAFRVINHTHDYPHAHIVINPGVSWSLDEQFGVDIDDNLLVRGYIVGKHALQVKDALLIAHFDGPETRGNTAGSTTGHMGQVGTVIGDVLFRPGLYGKAIEVTDASANLVSNPSFETNTTGWTDYSNGSATGSRARSLADSYDGTYAYRLQKTGGASADRWGARADFAVTNGLTYAVSCRVRVTGITAGTTGVVVLRTDTNVSGTQVSQDAMTDDWIELKLTTTATATGTARVYVWIGNCTAGTFYADAVQVVQSAYHVPYFAGTRANGSLTYSSAPVSWQKFTAMGWVKFPALPSAVGRALGVVELYSDASNYVRFYVANADDALFGVNVVGGTSNNINGALPLTADTWHHVAIVVDNGTGYVYLNGTLDVSASISGGVQTDVATVYVARLSTGNRLNGWLDDFAIVNRALPADEIRAIYESNAPIFAETSTWHWRGGRNRVWADAEGLWMLSADGNAVLGAYAGDDNDAAATKAWGGFTLGEGDIAFGHNRTGSSGIWWDRSSGKFGFYGNGGGSPQVEINTDGTLYVGTAGAARVEMKSTQLAGYNGSNVRQWYGSTTDGKFYAGQGNVTLDTNGIGIYMDDTPSNGWNEITWARGGGRLKVYAYMTNILKDTVAVIETNGDTTSDESKIILVANDAGAGDGDIILSGYVGVNESSPARRLHVGGTILADGDEGGHLGAVGFTNATVLGLSTGTGTVKLTGTTARNSAAWVKIYIGTTPYWFPVWSNIT
jgi:hypothetical protein